MSEVLPATGVRFDTDVQVLIIGAGACGLTAALAARDRGSDVLVLERDATPSGSTALSSGFVPAAPTRFQRGLGIEDSVELFLSDIVHKTKGGGDAELARTVVTASAGTLEWFEDGHGLEWLVLDDFLYPGHRRHRMHAVPEKTGAALMARLVAAGERADVPIATDTHVNALYVRDDAVCGARVVRPGGDEETISCRSVILACNGYGGNRALIRQYVSDMDEALYFGHAGNRGDALLWGQRLGAATRHLSGYQGHGSVATPHGILVTWALMMEGGIQVNAKGVRFSNEHEGYSEQAVQVLR
ncbi:MAG: FAD-dependent oxidoreductase, partial [Hyphomicrobiales bacterium]